MYRSISLLTAIRELPRHWARLRNAHAYGIPFNRRAGFVVPAAVRGKPLVHINDDGVSPDFLACLIEDCYGLSQATHCMHDGFRVLDIGANMGFFSAAATLRLPGAIVHAYEPNPRISGIIDQNAAIFGFSVHHDAVGPIRETVAMCDSGPSNFASTLADPNGGIQSIAASEAVARIGGHIDLLKLDAEGAEWPLLDAQDFWPHVDRVRMEFHEIQGHTRAELKERLGLLGFKVTLLRPVADHCGILWGDRRRT